MVMVYLAKPDEGLFVDYMVPILLPPSHLHCDRVILQNPRTS